MDTFKIRAVLTAVKLGSLSKAAEEISYTPSAFSRLLSSLEEELGVTLLIRSSTGVKLSEAGKTLYPHFLSLLKEEANILEAAQTFHAKNDKTLCIATYSSISRNLLSKLMKDFHCQYPDIILSIKVLDDLNRALESAETDIVFADGLTLKDYDWTLLATDRYSLVAEKGFAEDGRIFSMEELYSELTVPYLNVQDQNLLSFVDESRFHETLTLKSEDDLSVIDMIKAGVGAAILPELVIKGITDEVSVREIKPGMFRSLGYACKQGKRSYALREFIKFLEHYKKSLRIDTSVS